MLYVPWLCLRMPQNHCGDLGLSSDFGVISPRKAATLLMHVANRVLTNRGLDESEAQRTLSAAESIH